MKLPEGRMTFGTTPLVVTIGIIALGIYDLVVVLVSGTTSSVSDYLIRLGFASPLIVFAFGFVAGHLFSYMKLEPAEKKK
jgi:hypothetical protein